MQSTEVWTIGHSNLLPEAFMGLLRGHDIRAIADVRRFPGSHRYPHFNSEELSRSLTLAEIDYVHFPELGGRRKAHPDSPNLAWRNESFRGYADYMATKEFHTGIEHLLELVHKKRTAIMCAEAVWWQCHRSMIADFLKAHGVRVFHILSENKTEEHPFTSPARIVEGKLTYSTAEQPELTF